MTDLTQDLAALDAALYMGPTPDQWQALRPDSEGDVTVAGPGGVPIAKCGYATAVLDDNHAYVIGYREAIANAHFIAACSPDRIRRLLDTIRALLDERDALEAENERLRAEVEALKTENETLRNVLKDADNELDWIDEEVGACDHSVGVCTCSYFGMRRKLKDALSRENINE